MITPRVSLMLQPGHTSCSSAHTDQIKNKSCTAKCNVGSGINRETPACAITHTDTLFGLLHRFNKNTVPQNQCVCTRSVAAGDQTLACSGVQYCWQQIQRLDTICSHQRQLLMTNAESAASMTQCAVHRMSQATVHSDDTTPPIQTDHCTGRKIWNPYVHTK